MQLFLAKNLKIMSLFGQNIKKIRKIKQLSQTQFADIFGLTRASIGAYEECRSEAKIDTILQIAKYFSISVDAILSKELTVNDFYRFDMVNKDLDKYHQIRENGSLIDFTGIPLVSDQLFGDYLANQGNKKFIQRLPKIKLPVNPNSALRAFVQTGNALQYNNTGIIHGDIIIAEETYQKDIEAGKIYIIVTSKDILIRSLKETNQKEHIFNAPNPDYKDLPISASEIKELWAASYLFTKHISTPMSQLNKMDELERRLKMIEKKLG